MTRIGYISKPALSHNDSFMRSKNAFKYIHMSFILSILYHFKH
jgi:hypothetical protein